MPQSRSRVFAGRRMITTSPRVCGYSDHPPVVKDKAGSPTRKERRTALIIGLPWIAFFLVYPLLASYRMKAGLGGELAYPVAFVHLFAILQLAALVDLVILDWLIVSRITPGFVIIPGSNEADYRDFSHHYRGHAWALAITLLAGAFAAIVVYL